MIKNIIFDFGDIFINLDKPATQKGFERLFGTYKLTPKLKGIYDSYEMGLISSNAFKEALGDFFNTTDYDGIEQAWNAIILDFPEYRLEFIESLARDKKYRLFLLSNTNALHIEQVIKNMTPERYQRFQQCFEKFYLSHEINLRKPNHDIYEFVLNENNLIAQESIFIDDTAENTSGASDLNINTWNLTPNKEDIIDLFSIQSKHFK